MAVLEHTPVEHTGVEKYYEAHIEQKLQQVWDKYPGKLDNASAILSWKSSKNVYHWDRNKRNGK